MSDSIDLRYKFTEDELVNVIRMQVMRPWYLRLAFAISMIVFFGGGILVLIRAPGIEPFTFASGAILLYLSLVYFNPLTRARIHREPKYFTEHVWRFDEAGVSVKTDYTGSSDSWKKYPRVREDNRFFLLYVNEKEFTPIPKRAFTNQEQLNQFRELLRRKISKDPKSFDNS